ncbi:eggshell protein 1-like [Procambarus clarkii]|uniref:eggshell protein 1-like n=1 Tax=Procambarus clarkii TaxID=6728 RepID=UPI001E6767A3|nr:pro-resilin-like isoform X5 [Procambarus clarkii]
MKVLLFVALLGLSIADKRPSNSYGAPNGGFGNGFGASNGAPSNGYTAPGTNGFGAPTSNGNGASVSNGFGQTSSNGFGAAPSNGYSAPPSNRYGPPTGSYGLDAELVALQENIPGGGVPGEDYPVLASPPDTGFSCDAQAVAGYYADTDPEARCQVFHICQDRAVRRQKDSFLCPNGTIFNQQYLVCDWWFNVDCSQAENFYSVNELIGVVPDVGYGYGPATNGIGNGNGNGGSYGNGNGANGNGRNGNGANGRNGNGANGSNGNNGYGSNGNGAGNGNGANGNGVNGNGASNGYVAPSAPSAAYGTPF